MIDIVERLRSTWPEDCPMDSWVREELDEAADTITALRAEVETLRRALKPFALVAEKDIGCDEADTDKFRPYTGDLNLAPKLTVGHLRQARAALKGGDHG